MAASKQFIVPADFPELKMLVWNRDPSQPIPAEEVFSIYERNWRHVDHEHLLDFELRLIERLTQEFGHGHMLVG
ncbi:hypothetical protein QBK99_12205 [Corticibacterium sp. UT-5YL-CI-8]|nr:hypothetical protein [Tianweitania sp. UT-5YL-CI-8]